MIPNHHLDAFPFPCVPAKDFFRAIMRVPPLIRLADVFTHETGMVRSGSALAR
jgi:hypothetical protein